MAGVQFLYILVLLGVWDFLILGADAILERANLQPVPRLGVLKFRLICLSIAPVVSWGILLMSKNRSRVYPLAQAFLENGLSSVTPTSVHLENVSTLDYIIYIYAIVVVILLIELFYSYRKARIQLGEAVAATVSGRLVYLSEKIPGALCFGLVPPKIYLPVSLLQRLSKRELELIVSHEEHHARLHDPQWKLLSMVIRRLLFFSPAAYFIQKKFELETELVCDESTMEREGATIIEYGKMLLSLTSLEFKPVIAGNFMSDSDLKRRLISMKTKTQSRPTLLMVIFCLMGLSGITAVALGTTSLQRVEPAFSQQRVTIEAKNLGVREAIESLLNMDSIRFSFEPEVTNSKRVSLTVKMARISEVFHFLVEEGGLSYAVGSDGVVNIGVR